jgi:membrane-bound metal-dependent hydrolase YbcI (DUF457 family)
MLIGHFGLGLGAKRAAPAVSLGTLFIACQFADLLFGILVLLGVEQAAVQPGITKMFPLNFVSYPYSHSLLAACLWSIIFGVAYLAARRSRAPAAVTLALLVISHWLLDFISHRPDLPLTLHGDTRVGLELWASIPGTLVVEGTIFAVGIALYTRTTVPRDRIGSIGLWSLVAVLLVLYLASSFGPPPPTAAAAAWLAEAMWLLVAWAYWVDRHRLPHRN